MTPTVTPSCAPRPNVSVFTESVGDGRLKLSIEASRTAAAPYNTLHRLQILRVSNAAVEVEGAEYRLPGAVVELDGKLVSTQIFVQRVTAVGAFTATIGIVDDCGEWQTSAGGGASAP
jgi:hypothetical protein